MTKKVIMVRRGGAHCVASGIPVDTIKKILDVPLSYPVDGAEYADAFQNGLWDGRKRLGRKWKGEFKFPAGLYDKAKLWLTKAGYEVESLEHPRLLTWASSDLGNWTGPEFRDYQQRIIDEAIQNRGAVLRMPIRSGKTFTAAGIIQKIQRRTLFVVTSEMLAHQAASSFRRVLPGTSTAVYGAGSNDDCDSAGIVVATVQAMVKRRGTTSVWNNFRRSFGCMFADEVHHLSSGAGERWRGAILDIEAPRRYGLSATIDVDEMSMDEGDSIWLEGLCGPPIASIGMSDMIREGWLVRPEIRFLEYDAPWVSGSWSQGEYTNLVANCEPRNEVLVEVALREAREGRLVLVDCSRVGHANALRQKISTALGGARHVAVMLGSTSNSKRQAIIERWRSGDLKVVVSTVLGEGIDIPELSVVINAEGGRGDVATVQRLRNMTPCPGKDRAIVYDFVDKHHPTLLEWTKARTRIYESEPEFVLV